MVCSPVMKYWCFTSLTFSADSAGILVAEQNSQHVLVLMEEHVNILSRQKSICEECVHLPFWSSFFPSNADAFSDKVPLSPLAFTTFSSCMISSPMAMVCPFEVSKFTVTSPSEMKVKKLLPSLTASLAPTDNKPHLSAFKFPWKQSRRTYWNVKHQAADLFWKINTVKDLCKVPRSLGGHFCSSEPGSAYGFSGPSSCLYTLASHSPPSCILVYTPKKCGHGQQRSCNVFQQAPNLDNYEIELQDYCGASPLVNCTGIQTEVLIVCVPG